MTTNVTNTAARIGRLTLGLGLSTAALGGGAATAVPTAGGGVAAPTSAPTSASATAVTTEASTLAGTRPAFRMPFSCGLTWRGSAWTYSDGHKHNPLKSVDWNMGSGNDDKGRLVRASAGGTVTFAGVGAGRYGNTVVIRHGSSGWNTRYAHMLDGSLNVTKGQVIGRGKVIGKVGQSGGQPSAHLHYEQFTSAGVQNAVVQGVTFKPDSVHYIKSTNAC